MVLLTLGALLHTDGPKCAMTPCLVRHQLPHRHCGDVALLTRGFALATAFALLFYVAIMFYCIHHSLPCSKRAWCDCVGSQTTATVSELFEETAAGFVAGVSFSAHALEALGPAFDCHFPSCGYI